MSWWSDLFVEVKNGGKVTYSPSDLNKIDRTYEKDVFEHKERKVMTPYRRVLEQLLLAQVRDFAFEQILDRRLYTFQYLLVVPDPYGVAKQTALLLFNSSKEVKIRYRVLGDNGADFEAETEYTTRHRVPIMGLYAKRSNRVELWMIDRNDKIIKHRQIRIYVSELPEHMQNLVKEITPVKAEEKLPFMVMNWEKLSPVVIDKNGDIRYSLQIRTNRIGLSPLKNGHFLFADRGASVVNGLNNPQPCRYHEMDYMGRVFRTFLISDAMGAIVEHTGDSLFFISASDDVHDGDCIFELDMNTGNVVKRFKLETIFTTKYQVKGNWTRPTSMVYRDGSLLICFKRLNTLLELDWSSLTVKWIIAPQKIWEGIPLQELRLLPEGEELALGMPDAMDWVNENEVLVFNNLNEGKVPYATFDKKRSMSAHLRLDFEKRTYEILDQKFVDKTERFGCSKQLSTGQEVLYQGEILKGPEVESTISVYDAEQQNLRWKADFSRAFVSAWEFDPDIKEYAEPAVLDNQAVFGQLPSPKPFSGQLPPETEEKVPKKYFGNVHICENLLIYSLLPGAVQRVYFIGENHQYVQDYSKLKPREKVRENFAVQVDAMEPDEYMIYIEASGVVKKLKNEICIKP